MSKIDSLLKAINSFEKLAKYSDRKSFLDKIAQEQSVYPGYELPNMTPNPNVKQLNKISPDIQDKLNELLVPTGKILPIKVDGILGPETRKAIDLFKKDHNIPSTTPDLEVFKQVDVAHQLGYASKYQPKTSSLLNKIEKFYKKAQDVSLPSGKSIPSTVNLIADELISMNNPAARSLGGKLLTEIQKTPVNYNTLKSLMDQLIASNFMAKSEDENIKNYVNELHETLKKQVATTTLDSSRLIKPIDYNRVPKLVAKVKDAVSFLNEPSNKENVDLYNKILSNLNMNQSADLLYKYLVLAAKKANQAQDTYSRDTLKYLTDFMLENYSATVSMPAVTKQPPEKPKTLSPEHPVFKTLKTPGPVA